MLRILRFPSATPRMANVLSPRSQLNSDYIVTSELSLRGALSQPMLKHMAMFLTDWQRALDSADGVPIPATLEQPLPSTSRCMRSSDEGLHPEETPKRPRVLTKRAPGSLRDPRLRARATPGLESETIVTTTPAITAEQTLVSAITVSESTVSATIQQAATTAVSTLSSFGDALKAPRYSRATTVTTATPATTATAPQPAAKPPKEPSYPPLIVDHLPNWPTHFEALRTRLGRASNARSYKKGVRFTPDSEQEFRIIQRYLADAEKEDDISWFAYPLPSERSRKVAIRGLLVTTTPDEIQAALEKLDYTVEYVPPIKARMGRPGYIFFAILSATPNLIPGIYGVTELLSMPGVVIEAWRSKQRPTQSHRCHRRMACVRCGGEHPARDCPRPKESPAICVNCGGPHPANYTRFTTHFRRELRINNKIASNVKTQPGVLRPAINMVRAEAQAITLMALANPPPPLGRRRRKRGGAKKKKTATITVASAIGPQAAPRSSIKLSQQQQQAHPSETKAHTQRPAHIPVERALDTIKDILAALKEGRDPTQIALNGAISFLQ